MSRPETPLTEFGTDPDPTPEPEPEAVDTRTWTVENGQQCQSCGGHVTDDFRRVFGDNENRVFGCPECMSHAELYRGAAQSPDAGGGR